MSIQKLTKDQALVITGYTGILACSFSDFHEDVEKRLQRHVFTHEFASPIVMEKIKEAYEKDFMGMIGDYKE